MTTTVTSNLTNMKAQTLLNIPLLLPGNEAKRIAKTPGNVRLELCF